MRASEILGAPVLDAAGNHVGVVRDIRIRAAPRFEVAGVAIGQPGWRDHAAHAWGFAAGRTGGPWLLRKLAAPAVRSARFATPDLIALWAPDGIRLNIDAAALKSLGAGAPR